MFVAGKSPCGGWICTEDGMRRRLESGPRCRPQGRAARRAAPPRCGGLVVTSLGGAQVSACMRTTLGLLHILIFVLLWGDRSVAWLGAAALSRAACAMHKNGDSVPTSRSAPGSRTSAAGTATMHALRAAREVPGSLWVRGRWTLSAGSKLCASAQPPGPYPTHPLRGGADMGALSMPDAGGMPLLTVAGRAVPPRTRGSGRDGESAGDMAAAAFFAAQEAGPAPRRSCGSAGLRRPLPAARAA